MLLLYFNDEDDDGTWNMEYGNMELYYDDEDDNGFSYTCNNMILFHIIMYV
jgi:hypothetical protein